MRTARAKELVVATVSAFLAVGLSPFGYRSPMKITHHGLEIILSDDWWAAAEMMGFVPTSNAYRPDPVHFPGRQVYLVAMQDIGPVMRGPGVAIFNGNDEASARERVVRILRSLRSGDAIPPVEVVEGRPGYQYPYKLVHGTHRFYCTLAAGYTHVPAVEGFDISTLDQ